MELGAGRYVVRKILPKLKFDLHECFVRVAAVDLRWGYFHTK